MMRIVRFIIVILIIAGTEKICGAGKIKGRLLTPKEGCGLVTKVKNNRIIGGTEAPIGAYPWIAVLGYDRKNTIAFECGGSLITSRHVLTAAHCIEDDLRLVRLGEHNLSKRNDAVRQDIRIARAVKHKHHYSPHKLNDIGMLHLERYVEFSDRIRPICLPLDEPLLTRDFVGDNPFVAGWGYNLENDFKAQDRVLMQLQVPVVETRKCRNLHLIDGVDKVEADIMINEHVICAGGVRHKGFWSGDSGGPLMLPIHQNGSFPFYQIGVVSFSWGCARDGVPGIYTKVQYHADWIKEQLENPADNKPKSEKTSLKTKIKSIFNSNKKV